MVDLIENKSYRFFLTIYILGIIVFSILYYLLPVEHGVQATVGNSKSFSYFDSLYFSVVTISSLGYGDFRPVGISRILSMLEVTLGLVIIAIMVSKLASERTSILVKLLYTSDLQQRVQKDINRLNQKNQSLIVEINNHDYELMYKLIEDLSFEFYAYYHYIEFQKKEGDLNGRWAEKLFLKLLRSIKISVENTGMVIRLARLNEKEIRNCRRTLKSAESLVKSINGSFKEENISGLSSHILKYITDSINSITKGKKSHLTVVNEVLISKVKDKLPTDEPWPKNIHKVIAEDLRISNSLAHKVISEILKKSEIEKS